MLDIHQTVANLVLDHSETAQVFLRHRIDFCCHGDRTIEAAATAKRVDLSVLVAELSQAISEREGEGAGDPRTLSTLELIEHLISRHHVPLRGALPVVQALARKVAGVHGQHNPRLEELAVVVNDLVDTLLPHLDDEEERLFPALIEKEVDRAALEKQFEAMTQEHLRVSRLLEQARAASEDFALPDWACRSYRTLFAELADLERALFTHVHLEHHVLRPRFAEAPISAST